MNRDRNPYPFHDMPRYDAERAARMAAAVAKHDERKRRAARNNRLARLAALAVGAVLAVLIFYGAAGDVLTLAGVAPR